MKILAFSDWRSCTPLMLEKIILENNPDLILYAGDDLERVLPLGEKILIRNNSKNSIEINRHEFQKDDFYDPRICDEASKKLVNFITKRQCPLQECGVPFFFVNGNDDKIIKFNGSYYLLLQTSHTLNF